MKIALKGLLLTGMLSLATSVSAIEIKTLFTLSETTMGQGQVCVNGCSGSFTVDLDQAAYGGAFPNQFVITDIKIKLDSMPATLFTTVQPGSSATVIDNKVTAVNWLTATSGWFRLSFNASTNRKGDWTAGGPGFITGGSGVHIPEPGSIALLGVGLLGLGLARKRKAGFVAVSRFS